VADFAVEVHITGKMLVSGVDAPEQAEKLVMDAAVSLAGKPLLGVQKYAECVREIVTIRPDNVKLNMRSS
jgi:hypothetical protein